MGQKVAITSDRPQTTRHAIRGIVHRPDAQLIVVDTPGLHKPRTLLGERLERRCAHNAGRGRRHRVLRAREREGRGLATSSSRRTESDREDAGDRRDHQDRCRSHSKVAAQLLALSRLGEWAEIVPVSAVAGEQVELLADLLIARVPEGPPLYLDGELTDEPEMVIIAELIREAALDGVREELPHSLAVVVEEMKPREGKDLIDVFAVMYVERPSQKAIVIGSGGSRLREVGTRARMQAEALLGPGSISTCG